MSGSSWRRYSWALLCALLLCATSTILQAQTSDPSSTPADNPFAQPLTLSSLLLTQIDSLVLRTQALQPKIDSLQALSDEQAQQIKDSAQAISDSQASSARLQGLLDLSEATRLTQEQQLRASTISLQDSQASLQAAQGDAAKLAAGLAWTRGLAVAGWILAVIGGGYAGGHLLTWW